jgi:hypothetical protein
MDKFGRKIGEIWEKYSRYQNTAESFETGGPKGSWR